MNKLENFISDALNEVISKEVNYPKPRGTFYKVRVPSGEFDNHLIATLDQAADTLKIWLKWNRRRLDSLDECSIYLIQIDDDSNKTRTTLDIDLRSDEFWADNLFSQYIKGRRPHG